MESPRQRCVRLLTALEDLADQEAACVRMGDFAGVLELQGRAAPIVADLVEHGSGVADAAVRQRVAAVLERRAATENEIRTQLDATKAQLDGLLARQRRVTQVAPAYAGTRPRRSQLAAVG